MQTLTTGQKLKLSDLTASTHLNVRVQVSHPDIDLAVFGLDENRQLKQDAYFVFFNQPASPEGAVRMTGEPNERLFELKLDALPAHIHRLMFAATSDTLPVQAMTGGTLQLSAAADSGPALTFDLRGSGQEKALMLMELYRHQGAWKIAGTLQGFNGGLKALLEHFGGEADESASENTAVTPAPPQPSVSQATPVALSKVDLRKQKVEAVLTRHGLGAIEARVMVVGDASGSMRARYRDGTVQETLERLVPVASKLDDNQSMEFWLYASRFTRMGDLDEHSVTGLIGNTMPQNMSGNTTGMRNLGMGNTEPPVMLDLLSVHREYRYEDRKTGAAVMPTLALFVTDGGIDASTSREIEQIIRDSADEPLFWQFVGLGNADYGVLDRLDKLTGRKLDNSGFFAVDDVNRISDDELYERLLSEFAVWWPKWKAMYGQGAAGTPSSPAAAPTAGKVILKKNASVDVKRANTITVTLKWERRGDLDLYAFYVMKNGQEGKIYFKDLGTAERPPFITHSGDTRTPGHEKLTLHRPDELSHLLIAAYSALGNGVGSFASYRPKAIITDNLGQDVTVPLVNRNHFSYWVAISSLDFTGADVKISQVERYSGIGVERGPLLKKDGSFEMNKGVQDRK